MDDGICVIYNPMAGRGQAEARLRQMRRLLKSRAVFRATAGPGHAIELAREAATAGFPYVAAAGGDGTVHEVANGILRAGETPSVLAVLPVGSANDYGFALGLSNGWWLRRDFAVGIRAVDVGRVSDPSGRSLYFVNSLGLGFNGAVTLEARKITFLRGVPLYLLAVIRAMSRRFQAPELRLTLDGQPRTARTLALTLALAKREGNFLLAPDARLDDGQFDYLHVGPLPRWKLIRYVPNMILGWIPRHDPLITTGRCREARVASATPLTIHADGEFFCQPGDAVREARVELLPGRLRVLGRVEEVPA